MTSRRAPGPPGAAVTAAMVVLCGALVARPSTSLANGRFPSAGQLVVDPTDGAHIVVRTTFGLLQSFDAGATWTWLCERAVGPDGFQDPELIVTTGGRIAVGLPDGLAIGERDGCAWRRADGLVGDEVIDLVVSGSDPGTAYAAAVVRVNGAFNGLIVKTSDGVTWSAPGALLPDTYPLTIEIAASRAQRLYLGANDGNLERGFIDVSDDGGVTWMAYDSPGGVDAVYVSAVDPATADRIYVRSYSPQSNLYVSEDGARTWATIVQSPVPLLGFALSPDGRQIAVGGSAGVTILARGGGSGGGAQRRQRRRWLSLHGGRDQPAAGQLSRLDDRRAVRVRRRRQRRLHHWCLARRWSCLHVALAPRGFDAGDLRSGCVGRTLCRRVVRDRDGDRCRLHDDGRRRDGHGA